MPVNEREEPVRRDTYTPSTPSKYEDAQPRQLVVPSTFWQQLIMLLLQLFGATPGAREQTHLISKLQALHTDLHQQENIADDESALKEQQASMQPERRAKFEADEAAKTASAGQS